MLFERLSLSHSFQSIIEKVGCGKGFGQNSVIVSQQSAVVIHYFVTTLMAVPVIVTDLWRSFVSL